MESFQITQAQPHGMHKARGRKQVNGIPDASLFEDSVKTGEDGHSHAAGQSAFDTRRNGIGFERKKSARKLRSQFQAGNFAARGDSRGGLFRGGNVHVLFVRENVEEPADTASDDENRAEDEDREAGDQTGEK